VRGVSSRRALGLTGLLHTALRVASGDVQNLQDMRIKIPWWHVGFEVRQQAAELHRLVWGAGGSPGPQRVDAASSSGIVAMGVSAE
jgi:hypothetical protein